MVEIDGADRMNQRDVFILSKPPHSRRAKLCLLMLQHSEKAILYLAGDGVYNLIDVAPLKALPRVSVLACQEDMLARGLEAPEGERVAVTAASEDFYRMLAEDIISEGSRIYSL